jgi:xanthine/CO dehydrogenase XdhC/CoxF family maturation factor
MGCNAKLEVLFEPCPGGAAGWLRETLAALGGRTAVVVSTLFEDTRGERGEDRGERALMIGNDAPVTGPLADGALGGLVRGDANRVMDEEQSDVVTYPVDGGEAHVLHEFLPRPIQLLVCGDGADVLPLVTLGAELGWQVEAVGKDAALPAADDRTAAVVMTHNYGRDLALLGQLLPGRAGYVGLLGPRSRTERLLEDLKRGGKAPNLVALQRLHAPVGLDIGAETPEEVALAIVAEVRAQMAGRAGGKLKERKGPIHERR